MFDQYELYLVIGRIKHSLTDINITVWEKKFLNNILEQIKEKDIWISFSENQKNKLEEIFTKTAALFESEEELLKYQ